MLIDVHAHFLTAASGRADWERVNDRRMSAGRSIGITAHVASILGSWGARSPVYFPSPEDVTAANDSLLDLMQTYPGEVYGYCVVNPNYPDHAQEELARCLEAGMIGVKLAASRRATDALLDPVATLAARRRVPVLHHVWQHRRAEYPGQEASDARELAVLALRHPRTNFIMAHLGGGGDWAQSLRVMENVANVWVDLSGSGVDTGMLERAIDAVGADRLLFGTDLTMETGWGKLRYLESLNLTEAELERIRSGNAREIFPAGAFG